MASLAEQLVEKGNEIVWVGCHSLLQGYCDVMRSSQIALQSSEKSKICIRCVQSKQFFKKELSVKMMDMDRLVTLDERTQTSQIISRLNPEQAMDFSIKGLPLGKIAMYLIVTTYKKSSWNLSEEEWIDFKYSLENVILTQIGMSRFLEQFIPDLALVYNSLYPVNNTVRHLLDQRGIPTYVVHGSMSLPRLEGDVFISAKDPFYFFSSTKEIWAQFKEKVCPPELLAEVTDHHLFVFGSKSGRVYSEKSSGNISDVLTQYGVVPGQKVFLATMSSFDELWASQIIGSISDQRPIFPDPVVWIEKLIEYFASHPSWTLIIRPHPREFPNNNVGIKSEHAKDLERVLLRKLPDNVKVNWPADRVSLYDLMEVTSVCLNAWSSAGEELGLMGIPVITYCPELLNWPGELDFVADNESHYFKLVLEAAQNGWSFERMRRFYRWKVLQFCRTTIRIQRAGPGEKSIFQRVYQKFTRLFDNMATQKMEWRQRVRDDIDSERVNKMLLKANPTLAHLWLEESQTHIPLESETKAMRREVQKIYQALYQNRPPTNPYLLQSRLWELIHGKRDVDASRV